VFNTVESQSDSLSRIHSMYTITADLISFTYHQFLQSNGIQTYNLNIINVLNLQNYYCVKQNHDLPLPCSSLSILIEAYLNTVTYSVNTYPFRFLVVVHLICPSVLRNVPLTLSVLTEDSDLWLCWFVISIAIGLGFL
jgi:hypothetical protein